MSSYLELGGRELTVDPVWKLTVEGLLHATVIEVGDSLVAKGWFITGAEAIMVEPVVLGSDQSTAHPLLLKALPLTLIKVLWVR